MVSTIFSITVEVLDWDDIAWPVALRSNLIKTASWFAIAKSKKRMKYLL